MIPSKSWSHSAIGSSHLFPSRLLGKVGPGEGQHHPSSSLCCLQPGVPRSHLQVFPAIPVFCATLFLFIYFLLPAPKVICSLRLFLKVTAALETKAWCFVEWLLPFFLAGHSPRRHQHPLLSGAQVILTGFPQAQSLPIRYLLVR